MIYSKFKKMLNFEQILVFDITPRGHISSIQRGRLVHIDLTNAKIELR